MIVENTWRQGAPILNLGCILIMIGIRVLCHNSSQAIWWWQVVCTRGWWERDKNDPAITIQLVPATPPHGQGALSANNMIISQFRHELDSNPTRHSPLMIRNDEIFYVCYLHSNCIWLMLVRTHWNKIELKRQYFLLFLVIGIHTFNLLLFDYRIYVEKVFDFSVLR